MFSYPAINIKKSFLTLHYLLKTLQYRGGGGGGGVLPNFLVQ